MRTPMRVTDSRADVAEDNETGRHRFRYALFDPSVASFLKGQVDRIHRTLSKSVIQIGKDLIAAKHYLSHGQFLVWLMDEVGIAPRTAQVYMQVAQWASGRSPTVAQLPSSVLYILSSPSAPEKIVEDVLKDVLKRLAEGERIPAWYIRQQIRLIRQDKNEAPDGDNPPAPDGGESSAPSVRHRNGGEDDVMEAVAILARVMADADFLRVKELLTKQIVLDDPGFSKRISAAFVSIKRPLQSGTIVQFDARGPCNTGFEVSGVTRTGDGGDDFEISSKKRNRVS
jgi:hypothetical protein